MIWIAIILIVIVPLILGFVVHPKRSLALWTYCFAVAWFDSVTFAPYSLGQTEAQRNDMIFHGALASFFISSAFYWLAVLVRHLSRWHER
jgi:hypothetical protein